MEGVLRSWKQSGSPSPRSPRSSGAPTDVVTRQLLPADVPLWGSALRALPAGLVLLAVARSLPRGIWWWRSAVLGTLNVGAFFLLVYLAAQLLPSSVAASVMALAPLTIAGFAWLLVAERLTSRVLGGAVAGHRRRTAARRRCRRPDRPSRGAGVRDRAAALLGRRGPGQALVRRPAAARRPPPGSWSPVAASSPWSPAIVEGAPPALDAGSAAGFAFTSLVATALAYVCWFAGLARLRAATVGVVGLLNPVAGVLLGALVADERFTLAQVAGIALVLVGILAATGRGSGTVACYRPRARTCQSSPERAPDPLKQG